MIFFSFLHQNLSDRMGDWLSSAVKWNKKLFLNVHFVSAATQIVLAKILLCRHTRSNKNKHPNGMWICWDVVCVSIFFLLSAEINNECMSIWFKRERIEHKRYIQINRTTKQTIINSTWIDEHLALRRHKDSWTIQFAKP